MGSAYVGSGDDKQQQSLRLQGMPAGIGSRLGRKRSRSMGVSTHPHSDQHQPSYQHHQGGASFEPIYSGVYVEYGVGTAEERPVRFGLGRQRSWSAGEIMHLQHGHGHPGRSGSVAGGAPPLSSADLQYSLSQHQARAYPEHLQPLNLNTVTRQSHNLRIHRAPTYPSLSTLEIQSNPLPTCPPHLTI